VAGGAAVDGPRDVGGAAQRRRPAQSIFHAIPEQRFRAGQSHGRVKLAVRQFVHALGHSGDAHVLFHQVVVGREVRVAERPILAVAVERGRFEVQIAEAIALPSPDHGAAAGHAQAADPGERHVLGRGVRLFEVVSEPVVVVFVAEKFLDGARPLNHLGRAVAILQLERRLVLRELTFRHGAPAIDQSYFNPRLGEPLTRPAA